MSAPGVFRQIAGRHALVRVMVAYAVFILTEYAVWIAVLVYAFDRGGTTEAGLVALAQLVPAAILAPVASTLSDLRSPTLLLLGGYLVQGIGTAAMSVAVLAGAPAGVTYLAAVIASTAVSTTRPAQSVVVPALTRHVDELTATNVVIGWLESVSMMVAGASVGVTLAFTGVGYVFAGAAVLLAIAAVLVSPLRVRSPGIETTGVSALRHVASGIAEVYRSPHARVLMSLLAAQDVVIGALDVLFVVVAIDVLHRSQAWVGYLNMAYGLGGVIIGLLAALMVRRRLGPAIATSAVLLGIALAATATTAKPALVVVLLALVGGTRALFDTATRTLLQRAVPAEMVARIFGLAEGVGMAGVAVGALLAPALVALGGGRLALAGVAAVLPLATLLQVRRLARIDQHARAPIVEMSLLRSIPLFAVLPGPALEGVARSLERVDYRPGAVIIRQGDAGDHYYAIADGRVEVSRAGTPVRVLGRGAGIGEIALLHGGPRTATAVATGPVTAYALDRDSFLTAVNGHVPTRRSATDIVADLRRADRRRRDEGRTTS